MKTCKKCKKCNKYLYLGPKRTSALGTSSQLYLQVDNTFAAVNIGYVDENDKIPLDLPIDEDDIVDVANALLKYAESIKNGK